MRNEEKVNYLWMWIGLSNSMILSGENHSDQSLSILSNATTELRKFEDLEAENQRLNELLTIERDVSEGALIANQLNFNVDKSVNESLQKLVNHVMNANQELKDENQRLRDANRWIPVSERLPETHGAYLVTLQCSPVHKRFGGSRVFLDGVFEPQTEAEVLAWREFPEPYEAWREYPEPYQETYESNQKPEDEPKSV